MTVQATTSALAPVAASFNVSTTTREGNHAPRKVELEPEVPPPIDELIESERGAVVAESQEQKLIKLAEVLDHINRTYDALMELTRSQETTASLAQGGEG